MTIRPKVQKTQNDTYKLFFSGNEAQYIYNEFPQVTANILKNGLGTKRVFHEPIQKGKWEAAFKKKQEKSFGFNFENSPFGDDSFDFYPTRGKSINIKYKDIFTGFVFYKSIEEFKTSSSKYQRYAAEQELEYALKYQLVDSIRAKAEVNEYKNSDNESSYDILLDYVFLYNYLDIILFIILLAISLPIATWHLIRSFRKSK